MRERVKEAAKLAMPSLPYRPLQNFLFIIYTLTFQILKSLTVVSASVAFESTMKVPIGADSAIVTRIVLKFVKTGGKAFLFTFIVRRVTAV